MSTSTTTTTTTTISSSAAAPVLNNVLHLFPEIDTGLATATAAAAAAAGPSARENDELAGYDAEQVRLMDEVCIVVDEDDRPIGSASKKTCMCLKFLVLGCLSYHALSMLFPALSTPAEDPIDHYELAYAIGEGAYLYA
jgi:isopentenyl-diphosphate delta-isomerase